MSNSRNYVCRLSKEKDTEIMILTINESPIYTFMLVYNYYWQRQELFLNKKEVEKIPTSQSYSFSL